MEKGYVPSESELEFYWDKDNTEKVAKSVIEVKEFMEEQTENIENLVGQLTGYVLEEFKEYNEGMTGDIFRDINLMMEKDSVSEEDKVKMGKVSYMLGEIEELRGAMDNLGY